MTTPITTSVLNWISPATMQALGWALLHFLWQGTALAALAGATMALCRQTRLRYLVGVASLALMLMAPVATFLYMQDHTAARDARNVVPVAAERAHSARTAPVLPAAAQSQSAISIEMLPWLVEAWLFGVVLLSLRSAGGFLLLERERRRQSWVVEDRALALCHALQSRLGMNRVIRYLECTWLQSPAVVGWFRPIVFLPVSALSGLSEEQLRLVIAHELAHIQRLDPFVNVFQVFVETVLFYHPAIWWLNREIRAEREHCCDETAVSVCGNAVEYARALTLMEEWRTAPGLAMAANRGPLTQRVVRVLGLKTFGSGMRAIGITGSVLCLTAALLAGHALLGIARPKAALAAANLQVAAGSQAASSQATASAATKPSAAHAQSESHAQGSSYIESMKAAGFADLTADELIAMKIQDVTPEYVHGMQEQGIHLDANKLIAMRVQDITPEYIREWRAAGLNPTADQLIALKVQDADAAYYRELKAAGIDADVDHLIALKVQDVTPAYVQQMRSAGLNLTTDQIIGMKVQDITPEYMKQLHDLGVQANGNDLIGMKVQDVTPEWIRGIQALGFHPTSNELIGMKVQDITPEYIKALQSAGFKPGINDIISAKVQDVTPEFIERAKAHGFKDLTLQKLIQLRELGILDSKGDI